MTAAHDKGKTAAGASLGVASLAAGLLALRGAVRKHRVARSANPVQTADVPPAPMVRPAFQEPACQKSAEAAVGQTDAGFDPLNFAGLGAVLGRGASIRAVGREAELKHGRLAMLATFGILSSPKLQIDLAESLNLPASEAVELELLPSLVDVELAGTPAFFLPAIVMITGWMESIPRQRGLRADRGQTPGDFGLVTLGLQTPGSAKWLHNAEVKNGRLAMVAIAAFVLLQQVSPASVNGATQVVAEAIPVSVSWWVLSEHLSAPRPKANT